MRLSANFFMRDFLYSEIANLHRIANIPDDPDLAIQAGSHLCGTLLDPLQDTFGRLAIRSAYRSPEVNAFGNEHALSCASNAASAAGHIWDRRDENGHMGAMACIVVPWFADRFRAEGDWRRMAWWIHDHLPYSRMTFFPKLWAFKVTLGYQSFWLSFSTAALNSGSIRHGDTGRLGTTRGSIPKAELKRAEVTYEALANRPQ